MTTSRTVHPTVASPAEIRAQFPALERRHLGQPVAYFDGPGGTQVPRAVGEALLDYLYHHNANTHWAYPTSAETDAALAHAREVFAAFLNAAPDEIAFGNNMTTLTMHLARALGRGWGPGDEVIVTELDHHANVAPWTALAKDRGITIRTVRMRIEDGRLDAADLERAITSRTRLLAIGAASNALGTITDVAAAARLAHAAGALVFVDGVHYAPHVLPDVRALDCDFFACSPYKFYGPHVGLLHGRKGLLAATDFPKLIPAPDAPPENVETGTVNHEGIVGAAAAVEWLGSLGGEGAPRARLTTVFAELHARARDLFRVLWEGLAALPRVRLFGPAPGTPRTATLGWVVRDVASSEVARRLADHAVFVSHGDFYAHTVIARLGQQPEGIVRAGCACYTTREEVDRLVAGVRAITGA
jgi:cysteine desulfurase family protein (TIGR01976 family)